MTDTKQEALELADKLDLLTAFVIDNGSVVSAVAGNDLTAFYNEARKPLEIEKEGLQAAARFWNDRTNELQEQLLQTQEAYHRMYSLLRRYRADTPLGNQPHMIALEVDKELAFPPSKEALDAYVAKERLLSTAEYLDNIADIYVMIAEHKQKWKR